MKTKRYVIVNAKRFFIFITLILILFTSLFFMIFNIQKAYGDILEENFKEYYISKGDNLWNIALENMPEGYDVRKMVYEIKKINGIDTGLIYEGSTIKIPVY